MSIFKPCQKTFPPPPTLVNDNEKGSLGVVSRKIDKIFKEKIVPKMPSLARKRGWPN